MRPVLSTMSFCAAVAVGELAQPGQVVAPGSTLAVGASLRTGIVEATVELREPARLLQLQYHEVEGWTFVRNPGEVRTVGRHRMQFHRRLGALAVPVGTEPARPVPDAGLGCSAAGGVIDPRSGECGLGGSATLQPVRDVRLRAGDYRGAVVLVTGERTTTELAQALAATRGQSAVAGLVSVAGALGTPTGAAPWALLRIPSGS